MKISKLVAISSLIAAASLPAAAIAQEEQAPDAGAPATAAPAAPAASATVAAGQSVYGPQGEEVAKVVSVDAGNVVIDTGTNRATLPASALTAGDKGPTIAYNKDQLNAAIEAANNQAGAAAGAGAGAGAEQPGQTPQG